jgi:hypothetical protein
MSQDGTPRDERFATPRTFKSISSKSDSKSESREEDNWHTPRYQTSTSFRSTSIDSSDKFSDFGTPRVLGIDNDGFPLTARSYNHEMNHYGLPTPRSNASTSDLNHYGELEDRYYGGSYGGIPSGRGQTNNMITPLAEDKEEEYTHGVSEGMNEHDIEDIFRFARHGRIDDMDLLLSRGAMFIPQMNTL